MGPCFSFHFYKWNGFLWHNIWCTSMAIYLGGVLPCTAKNRERLQDLGNARRSDCCENLVRMVLSAAKKRAGRRSDFTCEWWKMEHFVFPQAHRGWWRKNNCRNWFYCRKYDWWTDTLYKKPRANWEWMFFPSGLLYVAFPHHNMIQTRHDPWH